MLGGREGKLLTTAAVAVVHRCQLVVLASRLKTCCGCVSTAGSAPLPSGQRDLWLLLAAVAVSYLVPALLVRREIFAEPIKSQAAIGGN